MASGEVVSLIRESQARNPVEYRVVFRHQGEGFSFSIYGVKDTPQCRRALAGVLRETADQLEAGGKPT